MTVTPHGQQNDDGSVVLYMALFCGIAAAVIMGLLSLGEGYRARRRLRNAVEVMALAAAASVREHGLVNDKYVPNQKAIKELGQRTARGTEQQVNFPEVLWGPEKDQRIVEVAMTATVRSAIGLGQPRTFHMKAYSEVYVRKPRKRRPAMILLLDFSLSMKDPMMAPDGSRVPMHILLTKVVMQYMIYTFPVRNGLIIFGGKKTMHSVDPALEGTNVGAIREALGILPCEGHETVRRLKNTDLCVNERLAPEPGGLTDVSRGFEAAVKMYKKLERQDPGNSDRGVSLITDGAPNFGFKFGNYVVDFWNWKGPIGKGLEAARRVRHLEPDGVRLSAIQLDAAGGADKECKIKFLKDIAANAMSDKPDPALCRRVGNLYEVDAFLRGMAKQVCRFGPLKVGKHDTLSVGYRESDESEEPVKKEQYDVHRIDDETVMVELYFGACSHLGATNGRRLVFRWTASRLVDESQRRAHPPPVDAPSKPKPDDPKPKPAPSPGDPWGESIWDLPQGA